MRDHAAHLQATLAPGQGAGVAEADDAMTDGTRALAADLGWPEGEVIARLFDMLDTLSERQAGVVSMRYGLTDGRTKTYREIAAVYGVSTAGVQQICQATLDKLRAWTPEVAARAARRAEIASTEPVGDPDDPYRDYR